MKKFLIISVTAILIIAGVISVIRFVPKTQDGIKESIDILCVSNESEIKQYIEEENVSIYSFDGDVAYIVGVDVFGTDADIELYMSEKMIEEINICSFLFMAGADQIAEDDSMVEDNSDVYQFTEEDKKSIEEKFSHIKENFEDYIGCTFTTYDIVPTRDSVPEDTDENFYNGDFIKEFSVRDANGILWIMRYEASYGSSSVIISKIINESGFEGFIPSIDLTK